MSYIDLGGRVFFVDFGKGYFGDFGKGYFGDFANLFPSTKWMPHRLQSQLEKRHPKIEEEEEEEEASLVLFFVFCMHGNRLTRGIT